MEIKTKYNCEDYVWAIPWCQVIQFKIKSIKINIIPSIHIDYKLISEHGDIELPEYRLFSSKEELIKSL